MNLTFQFWSHRCKITAVSFRSKSELMPCLLFVFLRDYWKYFFYKVFWYFKEKLNVILAKTGEGGEGRERHAVQEEVTFRDVLEQYELALLTCKRLSKELSWTQACQERHMCAMWWKAPHSKCTCQCLGQILLQQHNTPATIKPSFHFWTSSCILVCLYFEVYAIWWSSKTKA